MNSMEGEKKKNKTSLSLCLALTSEAKVSCFFSVFVYSFMVLK